MKEVNKTILERLHEVQEVIYSTLQQKDNFTVKTTSSKGVTYSHDRESYLQFGLEVAYDELQAVIEDIEERLEKKSRFKVMK